MLLKNIIFLFYLFSYLAQPPGAPEICKKSLRAAPCDGGTPDTELFIIGKNFLKDTKVVLREVILNQLSKIFAPRD